jgi:hypothetical protein
MTHVSDSSKVPGNDWIRESGMTSDKNPGKSPRKVIWPTKTV